MTLRPPFIESGFTLHAPWTTPSRAWRDGVRLLACWYARQRQRRALATLSPERLHDIGVTRAQAAREAAKPFWRA